MFTFSIQSFPLILIIDMALFPNGVATAQIVSSIILPPPNFKKEENNRNKEVKETKEVVASKNEVKENKVDFSSLTVAKLREIAKEKEIAGYTTMKKDELINALK